MAVVVSGPRSGSSGLRSGVPRLICVQWRNDSSRFLVDQRIKSAVFLLFTSSFRAEMCGNSGGWGVGGWGGI